jgi:uncharacterized protein YdeI (YjbR/CyaY-like superfamily)
VITDIEDYFSKGCGRCKRFGTPQCSTKIWTKALADLRRICLKARLTETVKWGHPCYMHAGRNIALIGAFQRDCRLTFMNAALLKDTHGVLEKPGPNTQQASMMRFTDAAQVRQVEPIIKSYLQEALRHAEAGTKAPKEKSEVILPDELVDALDADPELAEAFHGLTPGRQRSYLINLSSAKTSVTKMSRISKFRPRIMAGKGANER